MSEQKLVKLKAFDLDDAWFQSLNTIIDKGRVYTIDRGSYQGQKRLEFDYYVLQVTNPGHQIIPIIPEGMPITPPTSKEYINGYLNYLLTEQKTKNEDYTYGERMVNPKARIKGKEIPFDVNPLEKVIEMYKTQGYGTNQACMEIAMPSDIELNDPPCMRLIDTRISYGKLHFSVYFRSWDLWGGFPSNLGGLQKVKEFMAEEIGVEDGEIIACSKGLHLYDHCWGLAGIRTNKTEKIEKLKNAR